MTKAERAKVLQAMISFKRLASSVLRDPGTPKTVMEMSHPQGQIKEAIDVSDLCLQQVILRTFDSVTFARKPWLDVFHETLDYASRLLRKRMILHCAPGVFRAPFSEVPFFMELLASLDYSCDLATAREEASQLQRKLLSFFDEATDRNVAVGLINSIHLNYVESIHVLEEHEGIEGLLATPAALLEHMVDHRLIHIKSFEEMLWKIFLRSGQQAGRHKVPLRIVHVTGLAQEYFWSTRYRKSILEAVDDVEILFHRFCPLPRDMISKFNDCFSTLSSNVDARRKVVDGGLVFQRLRAFTSKKKPVDNEEQPMKRSRKGS